MVIEKSESPLHWNYFLALEADLERLARFIEFDEGNFRTYSIEIARLLQTACSEVDVIARQLCDHFNAAAGADDIGRYRSILRRAIPNLETATVDVPRYGLGLVPWSNWQEDRTPSWWDAHNQVKHRRNEHFHLANVGHLLNAAAGLLLLTMCFYRHMTVLPRLEPPPSLLKPDPALAKIAPSSGGGVSIYFARGWLNAD